MFDRIKKAFSRDAIEAKESVSANLKSPLNSPLNSPQSTLVSEWSDQQGYTFSGQSKNKSLAIDGKLKGKPWRLEVGAPQRNFICGEELRARAELGLDEDISVLVMSRALKNSLEKKAYDIYTDDLQTTIDPNLPEEMRWLAVYQEVGWDGLPGAFWDRYSVLSDDLDKARAWVTPQLAVLMLEWPLPEPHPEVPVILMLLRGKAYLRMEYAPASLHILQHANQIFATACQAALDHLATDISL